MINDHNSISLINNTQKKYKSLCSNCLGTSPKESCKYYNNVLGEDLHCYKDSTIGFCLLDKSKPIQNKKTKPILKLSQLF